MVRQAGTDWALMRNDYSNDRLTYVVSLLYYHPSQTKTETATKERFEICLLYEIVEKNRSSCDKFMSCVWMIFAHFAVSAVGSEGHNDYTLKIITGF